MMMTAKPTSATSQCVMGFDFGIKRVGVAVGDTLIGIAHAIETIHAESNADKMNAIDALVAEWKPSVLVVGEATYGNAQDNAEENTHGRPDTPKATPHPVALLAHKFGNRLKERHRLPVEYINEFLSSSEASGNLAAQGIKGRAQKAQLDAAAAQVILQSYFDARQTALNIKANNAA